MQKVILKKSVLQFKSKRVLLGSHSSKQCISDTIILNRLWLICVPAGPDIGD